MDAFLGFEDDPKFFVSAMYLSTLHSVPLFFVAVYCIIRVSPPKMGRYKWWLLYHVVTSFTGEIALNCGAIPVLYLPVVGGYPRGLFWTLGMPTITMLALMTTIFLEVIFSILHLFYYRYRIILPTDHKLQPRLFFICLFFAILHTVAFVVFPLLVFKECLYFFATRWRRGDGHITRDATGSEAVASRRRGMLNVAGHTQDVRHHCTTVIIIALREIIICWF
ncbi:hypothetical protein Aduo_016791 [Ancylostoma duodenale]